MRGALVVALLVGMGGYASASTGETKTIVFDGTQSTNQLTLKGEKTHTESHTQVVPSTCYEDVQVGSHQECRDVGEEVCGYAAAAGFKLFQRPLPPGPPPEPSNNPPSRPLPPGPAPEPSHNPPSEPDYPSSPSYSCHTSYHTECDDVPDYETRAYDCDKEETTYTEVHDYNVNASVLLAFGSVPAGITPKENIAVTLDGEDVRLTIADDKRLVLFGEPQVQSTMNGGTKSIAVTYNIDMASTAEILNPFTQELADFAISQNTLTFTVAQVIHPDTFLPHLKLELDKQVVDRDLKQSEYQLIDGGNGRTLVSVPLAGLGLSTKVKDKVKINATVRLVIADGILNRDALPAEKSLTAKAKVKIKN